MDIPVIYAHRGASAYAPENTMSAFKKALEMKATGIELDVHVAKDGEVVVIHDASVNRTSNGEGLVKDMTLDELKNLDFGSWKAPEFSGEKISTLEEVMELLTGWDGILNIEIKSAPGHLYADIEQKIVDLANKYEMMERIIISSFNHYSLLTIKGIAPEIKTAPLYSCGLVDAWEYAKKIKAHALHPSHKAVVPEIIKMCRENGVDINLYTVDDPERVKQLALAGATGIITNVPDVALQALGELKK